MGQESVTATGAELTFHHSIIGNFMVKMI